MSETRRAARRRQPSVRGRADECEQLDAFVEAIRRGEGRSLVVRGEAGIGKTALLEYLVESAPDVTVLRAVGVQSEWSSPTPVSIRSALRCSIGSTGCRVRSVRRSRSPTV